MPFQRFVGAFPIAVALLLGGCATSKLSQVPAGPAAYEVFPPPDPAAAAASYVIVPKDTLNLQVFQEPDLSNDELQVDDVGNIQMPLIGEVRAAGRTASELAAEISQRLRQRFIVDPQVVVSIAKAATRFVTVEGQVKKPGVYEIDRVYTLLSAIARAEGPSETARLDEAVIFRTVDGKRLGARFDLSDIRAGKASDPQIQGGDVVILGHSGTKGIWRDLLQAAPLTNIFYMLRRR